MGGEICLKKHTFLEIQMRVVNFSDTKNNLKSVLDKVVADADYTIVTRRDAEDAVIMSLDTFNSYQETLHLLKSPANARHLAKSVEQYRNGHVQEKDLIDV